MCWRVTSTGGPADSQWAHPPAFPSGRDGLISTADDYLAFGRMLLDPGQRLLSRPLIEQMTTDQLTDAEKAISPFFPGFWDDHGWGFGVSMVTRPDTVSATPGRFGWDGGYGTFWTSDPGNDLVAILLTQRLVFPLAVSLERDFRVAAYRAISD